MTIEPCKKITDLLQPYADVLGDDLEAYHNHCQRVWHFTNRLAGSRPDAEEKIAIAVSFHDLGLWTERSLDYLPPSRNLAEQYLHDQERVNWIPEVIAMIDQHHKIRKYRENPGWLVEPMRQADLMDLSFGRIRFGLSKQFIEGVKARFPNAGFHACLMRFTVEHMKSTPLSNPLAMFRL